MDTKYSPLLSSGDEESANSSLLSSNDKLTSTASFLKWTFAVLIFILVFLAIFFFYSTATFPVHNFYPKHAAVHQQPSEEAPSQQLPFWGQSFNTTFLKDFVNQKIAYLKVHLNLSSIIPPNRALDETETMKQAETESNVAGEYWLQWRDAQSDSPSQLKPDVNYCSRIELTNPYRNQYNNEYWQIFRAEPENRTQESIEMFLYNAYYDNRISGQPVVRLISVNTKQRAAAKRQWWCLLWFDHFHSAVVVKASSYFNIWPDYWGWGQNDGIYGAQIITCPIPKPYLGKIPKAVSLQSKGDCRQMALPLTNVLRVIYNRKPSSSSEKSPAPSIGVCVKGLRFGTIDYSVRLVEWLEMLRLLQADHVYIYEYSAHVNVRKVLEHYQMESFLTWQQVTLPGTQPNIESLYERYANKEMGGNFWPSELLEYNDCLYRNLYRHDFLAVFDVDEVIMPLAVDNWKSLLQRLESSNSKSVAAYSNRHAYFYSAFEETSYKPNNSTQETPIPAYLHMMRHTYRAPYHPDGANIKCFHRTSLVASLHNHYPRSCLSQSSTNPDGPCRSLSVPTSHSLMMHFRVNRSPSTEDCNATKPIDCTIHDTNAWRFFSPLKTAVTEKLWIIFT